MEFYKVALLFIVGFGFSLVNTTSIYDTSLQELFGNNFIRYPLGGNWRRRCPLCDTSVYSYCSDKLFHDSCCCTNPNNPYEQLPHQCQFADCSFLHANSCQEHKLITACCCISK